MFERIVLKQLSIRKVLSSAPSLMTRSLSEIPPNQHPNLLWEGHGFDDKCHYHCCLTFVTHCRCRHCQELAPVWDQLANKCADSSSGPRIAKVCYPWS